MYYYNARYYNPALGRFISADPLLENPSEFALDTQQRNGYAYVGNNPVVYWDWWGLYVVETGEIEEGDTEEDIVEAVNEAFGIETDWETIAFVSFFEDRFGTTDVNELVGESTYVGINDVYDLTMYLDLLNRRNARYAVRNDISLIGLAFLFRPGGEWDFKNLDNRILGYSYDKYGGRYRKYWAYIYDGELIRFDAPGNINYGYVFAARGYQLGTALHGAHLAQQFDNYRKSNFKIFGDNNGDGHYIIEGYLMF